MGGGGKGGSSVQTVSIPPEVLARYNAVNARAENVATTPFTAYGTTPEAFVAPLSTTQQAGMANINALQGSANQAVGAGQGLQGQGIGTAQQAQAQAQGVNMAALQGISQAQQQGTAYNQAAGQNIGNAMGVAAPFMQGNAALQQQGLAQQQGYQQAATQNIGNIAASAQPYLQGNAALQQQGLAQQQGYQRAATQNAAGITQAAQPYLAGNVALQQQGLAQQQGFQQAAAQNAANIAQSAQPYLAGNAAMQQQGYAQQQAAQNAAIQNAMNIAGAGSPAQQQNMALQQQGLALQQGYQNAATQNIGGAMASASPYMGQMAGLTQAGLGAGQQYLSGATGLTQQALQTGQQMGAQAQPFYTGALQAAQPFNQGSAQLTQGALQAAQPLNQGSAQLTQGALQAAQPLNQGSAQLTQAALQSANPLNQAAQQYMGAGAQAVGPEALNYGQYMNPFLSNVVGAQQALQAQENAAQRSAMKGKAIQSGAFGGDRAGIEQANLARQQSLANQATLSNLLQSGFNQAQQQAAQQQGVSLGAAQANRAAQQQAAQQAAALGQQQYAQNLGAAQQIGNLGQQNFAQNLGAAQQLGTLGQQNFAQNLGAAQQIGNLGQQNYAQTLGVGTNLAALGQQQYAQQLGAGAQIGNLGQQGFQQALGAGAQLGQVGQNLYNQNIGQGQALANLGQQGLQAMQSTGQNIGAAGMNLANLQSQQAQQMSNIGQQALQAGQTTGANLGAIGMNQAALQGQQAQQMAALGQQGLAALQGTGTNIGAVGLSQSALQGQQAQQMAALGQQGLGALQGTGANLGTIGMNQAALQGQQGQGLAALGQQGLAALQGTGTNLGNIGQQLFGQNIAQGQAIQGLGQQQFAQGLAGAQGAANIGQNMFGQGAQTAGLQQAGGMNIANLGLQNQGAQIGAAQAQMAAGQQQQQTEQAARTALYNQFLQQQGYPFQIAQFLGNLAMGTGSLSGSTTTATRTGYRGGRMGDGYASGGLVPPDSQGGAVYAPGLYARGGYAPGGMPDTDPDTGFYWDNSIQRYVSPYTNNDDNGRDIFTPEEYDQHRARQGFGPLAGTPADVPKTAAEVSPQLADVAKTNPALQQNISDYQAVSGVNKDISSAFKDATGKDIDAASARKYQDMLNAGMSLDQVKYNINTSQPALLKAGDVGALKGQSLAYNPANFSMPSAPVKNQFGSYAAPAPQQASGKGASQPQPQTQPYYGQPAYNYGGGYGGGYSQPNNYGMPNFGNYGGAPNYAGAAYYGGQQQYGYQPQQPQQASGKGASQPQPQPTYQAPQATGKGASQPAAQPPQASGKGMSTGGRTAYASGGRAGYAAGGGDPSSVLRGLISQYDPGDPQGLVARQAAMFAGAPGSATGYVPPTQSGAGQYKMMTPQASILPQQQSGLKEAVSMGTSIASLGEAGGKLYDKLAKNPTTGVVPDSFSEGMSNFGDKFKNLFGMGNAAGGRIGYNAGGIPGLDDLKQGYAAIPGGEGLETPMGKVVSQGTQTPAELKAQMDKMSAGTGGGGGGSGGGLAGALGTASSLASLGSLAFKVGGWMMGLPIFASGGRVGKAGGGALVDPSNPQDQAMAEAFDNLLQRYDNNPLLAAAAMDVGTKAVDAAIMKAEQTGGDVTDFLPRRTQEYMFALSKAAIGAHDAMNRQERKAGGRTGYKEEGFVDDQPTGLVPAPKPSPSEAMTTGDVLGGLAPQGAGVQVAGPTPAADKGPDLSPEALRAYTAKKAGELKLDPDFAVKVFGGESGFKPHAVGDDNSSFNVGQFHYGNVSKKYPNPGLGDQFTKDTGLDARDPNNAYAVIDYGLTHASKKGWNDWTVAKNLMAQNQGNAAPVQTAGLAPQTKTDAGPFEKTFGKAMPDSVPTDSSFWVPLIAGLGTMLASDKYRFSQRIGEGLVGGAAAYGKQQEFGLNKERLAQEEALRKQGLGIQQQQLGLNERDIALKEAEAKRRALAASAAAAALSGNPPSAATAPVPTARPTQGNVTPLQPAAGAPSVQGGAEQQNQPENTEKKTETAIPAASSSFWQNVDPQSNPHYLNEMADRFDRAAAASADDPTSMSAYRTSAQQYRAQASAIRNSGLVTMKDQSTASMPGFNEAKAAQLAATKKAELETAEPFTIRGEAKKAEIPIQLKARTDAANEATVGRNLLQQTDAMMNLMFDKNGKPVVNSGPLGAAINKMAAVAKQAGFSDSFINDVLKTDPSNAQSIEKLRTTLSTEIGRQEMNGAPIRVTEFQRFLETTPGETLLPESFKWIVENILQPKAKSSVGAYEKVKRMDPAEHNIQAELDDYARDNKWYGVKPGQQNEPETRKTAPAGAIPPGQEDLVRQELLRRKAVKGAQ